MEGRSCSPVRRAISWLIGSPKTVAEKLRGVYDEVGGFGTLLLFCFDYKENPEAWHTSMQLLAKEVIPQVAGLQPRAGSAVSS